MLKKTFLLAAAVSLAACGGSSSGGKVETPQDITVSGIAAKGIIQGATVEVRNNQNKLLGSTTTNNKGAYELEVPAPAKQQVWIVTVKPVHSGASKVVCDANKCGDIKFGDTYTLGYSLESAVSVEPSSAKITANITPLTHMVSQIYSGGANLQQANSNVVKTLGLQENPNLITPIDWQNPPSNPSTSVLAAALVNASFEVAAGSPDKLGEFLDSAVSQTGIDRAVAGQLSSAAEGLSSFLAEQHADLSGALSHVTQQLVSAVEEATDIQPTEPPTTTNLAAAKRLLETVRNVSVNAYDEIDGILQNGEADDLNSLIGTVISLENGLGDEFAAAVSSAALVLEVASYHALSQESLGEKAERNPVELAEIAGRYFEETRENWCDWYADYLDEEWAREDYQWCLGQYQADKSRFVDAFRSGEVAGEISSSGEHIWKVESADYLTAVGELAQINFIVKVPTPNNEVRNEDGQDWYYIGLLEGEHSVVIQEGSIVNTSGDISVEVAPSSAVTFRVDKDWIFDGFGKDIPGPLVPSLDAELAVTGKVGDLNLEADVALALKSSSTHKSLNERGFGDWVAPLPTQVSVNGAFWHSNAIDQRLDASIDVHLNNIQEYGFYQGQQRRDDLAHYQYNQEDNSITLTLQNGEDSVVATYRLGDYTLEQPYRGSDYAYIDAELIVQCDAQGNAGCDKGYFYPYLWGEVPVKEWKKHFDDGGMTEAVCNSAQFGWKNYVWEDSNCFEVYESQEWVYGGAEVQEACYEEGGTWYDAWADSEIVEGECAFNVTVKNPVELNDYGFCSARNGEQEWVGDEVQCVFYTPEIDYANSLLGDIRLGLDNWMLAEATSIPWLRVSGEGKYQASVEETVRRNIGGMLDYWEFWEVKWLAGVDSDDVVALTTETDVDNAERHLQGTIRVELEGKLAKNLPELKTSLVVNRTAYRNASAELSLAWGNEKLLLNYDYYKPGENLALFEHPLIIKDGQGTSLELWLDKDSDELIGTISKDKTLYGNIRNEKGAYVVTWSDGSFETLY